MKTRHIIIAATLAALAVLSAGCKKSSWRPVAGEQIKIRTVSNADKIVTKVAYDNNGGNHFDVEGVKYDRIDWEVDDDITIAYLSHNGGSGFEVNSRTYLVTDVSANGKSSYATVTPKGGNGLEWTDKTYHQFYGCSPAMDEDEEYVFEAENDVITAVVPFDYPEAQTLTQSADDANVFLPDMRGAVLLCEGSSAVSLPVDGEKNIQMAFSPHFNAFEFRVSAASGDSFPLKRFVLSSASVNLSGRILWTLNPSTLDWDDVEKDGTVAKTVSVDFEEFNITLTDSQTITFTVITRSWHLLSDLTVSFTIEKDGADVNRSLKLNYIDGRGVEFENDCKHIISGLQIPLEIGSESLWFEGTDAGGYEQIDWNL